MKIEEYFNEIDALSDEEFEKYMNKLGVTKKKMDKETISISVSKMVVPKVKFNMDLDMEVAEDVNFFTVNKVA